MEETLQLISSLITSVAVPLLGIFLFYDSKRRAAAADATRAETENITQYADEWQKLYNEKAQHETLLNAKIDTLYTQLSQQRDELNQLKTRLTILTARLQYTEPLKCTHTTCTRRQPPYTPNQPNQPSQPNSPTTTTQPTQQ